MDTILILLISLGMLSLLGNFVLIGLIAYKISKTDKLSKGDRQKIYIIIGASAFLGFLFLLLVRPWTATILLGTSYVLVKTYLNLKKNIEK